MIPTTLTNLILYNLCALLAVLGLLWIYRIVRWRWREHRRRRHSVVCSICGHRFKDASREQAVECPACRQLVQRQEVLEL
jgi:tellurite resistance protein TehA-like permease